MGLTVAELVAKLSLDDTEFKSGMGELGKWLGSAAIIAGLNRIQGAASDLQQTIGGTEAVFGEFSTIVDQAAKSSAESMGLSERAFRESTSRIGAMLKGFGYDQRAAAEESIRLTQVGADLAATFGGTTAEAVDALGAALRGEMDPVERYGISLRAASVEAKAMEMGLYDGRGEIDATAKATATLALITDQAGGALGQFGREAETSAGKQQIAQAKLEDAQARMGQSLLPLYAKVYGLIGSIADAFGSLPGPAQTGIVALAGITAAITPVSKMVSTVSDLSSKLTEAADSGSSTAQMAQRLGPAVAAAGVAVAGAAAAMAIWNARMKEAEQFGKAEETGARSMLAQAEDYDDLRARFERLVAERNATVDEYNSTDGILDRDLTHDLAQQAAGYDRVIESTRRANEVTEAFAAEGLGSLDEGMRLVMAREEEAVALLDQGLTPAEVAARLATEARAEAEAQAATETAAATAEVEAQEKALRELIDAMADHYEESFRGLDALADWHGALDDLTASVAEHGATLDLDTEAGRANYAAARDLGTSLVDLMQRRLEETGSVQAAIDAGNGYVQNLKDQLREAGLTEAEIDGYIDTLNLVPEDIATNITADPTEALTDIDKIKRELAIIAGTYSIDFNAGIGSGAPRYRAAGGRTEPGVPYKVGEVGEEWFVPDTAGTVFTAQQTRDMATAGMGSGGTYIAELHLTTSESARSWLDEAAWRGPGL